ncbi:MAG: glycosyltransferase family 4 protein [Dokdonella sp.]|jgi:glycosyltransferase involved in cell wall biosynthesis|nr:glycosyltransferase family 4 protein [Dokdonella sp.]
MRLLMLTRYGPLGASSRLRSLQYLPALRAAGIETEVSSLLDDGYVRGLYTGHIAPAGVAAAYLRRWRRLRHADRYDLIWIEKEAWPWLPGWLERALLGRGTRLVLDYDDALFHRYDSHRSRWVRTVLGSKIDGLMRRADLVTAGNDYLAAHARAAGCRHVARLPTVVDLTRYPLPSPRAPDGRTVVVGWIGSPSTAGYLRAVAKPLASLQAAGRIRCVAIGARPDQVEGTPFEAVPWHESTEAEQLRQCDIGIMPLPDGPWERGKCGYKLIQYMACGLPVVASPVGINVELVADGERGWLAAHDTQWSEAIARLAADPSLRRRMGEAGRALIERHYSLQVQAGRLIELLRLTARAESIT